MTEQWCPAGTASSTHNRERKHIMSQSKQLEQAQDQKFIAAFTKYFGKKATIVANETGYSHDQITQAIQGRVDSQADVETTRGKYSIAVAEAKAAQAVAQPSYDAAKQAVFLKYGSNPAVLSEFGLAPRKKAGVRDVATKQAAITQAKATRLARHTMGPRQKAKVKGVVTPASSDASVAAPEASPSSTATTGTTPAAAVNGASITVTPQAVTGH
jgi:hypothetical protein